MATIAVKKEKAILAVKECVNLGTMGGVPKATISKADFEYIITIPVPGYAKEDFLIEVSDGELTVNGQRKASYFITEPGHYHFKYNKWQCSFTLPVDGDGAFTCAHINHDELMMHIPKGRKIKLTKPQRVYVY